MRMLIAILLLAGAALAGTAQAGTINRNVDLSVPGAIESLRDRDPAHFAKVSAILSYVEANPTRPDSGRLIETRFDAADVEMLQWRVSNPPKLRVSFTLDSTRYSADVVPNLPPARAVPTR